MSRNTFFFAGIVLFTLVSLGVSLWQKSPEAQPSGVSGALKALAAWSAQRAYPYADIPDVAQYAAFEYSKQHLRPSRRQKRSSTEPWYTIGPVNMGGRTLAIAIDPQHPDIVYAGSASGGLWRSTSGGRGASAWAYLSTGFPVLAVSSIAIDPTDSETIYIDTGEVYNFQNAELFGEANRSMRGSYSMGILSTTDGGASWSKSLDWSANQRRGVQAVKIDPTDSSTVWAATTEGAYKSTDGGATWGRVLDVIMATDLVINPLDPDIVIAACGNFSSPGRGIYRTTDGGRTWTRIRRGLTSRFIGKILLDICKTSPHIVYASMGSGFSSNNSFTRLIKSDDAGQTWATISTQNYAAFQGWFSHDVAVNPVNPDEVFAVGLSVWRSMTGGRDLERRSSFGPFSGQVPPGQPEGPPDYVHSDVHDVVYHPRETNIVYFATDGGVFRTTDGGQTFESCNGGYQTTQFYNGFSSSPTDPDLALGGLQDNSTIIYRGSTTWSKFHIGGDGSWTAIDPRPRRRGAFLYGSAQGLRIFKSFDGGENWSPIAPVADRPRPSSFIAPFVLAPSDPDVLYAGRDLIFKTTNGGARWEITNGGNPLDGNTMLAMAVSQQNSDLVYATTVPRQVRGGVFRTTDGGDRWVNITGDLPDRFPSDLILDPTNDAIVYVTFSGFGTSHLFKSENSGESWQDIGVALPDVPTNAVIVDPLFPDRIYLGNDIGVYISINGGRSWQEFNQGLPVAVAAFDLSISPINRKLRLATHGNGVFERDLIGGEGP